MRIVKAILGYGWALLALPIVLATFIGMNGWAKGFAQLTGLRISPWMTGGEVVTEVEHEGYTTSVYEPVFRGLIGERKTGFVQIRWAPGEGLSLPDELTDQIDFDNDGAVDFAVTLDTRTNEATLDARSPNALSINGVIDMERERAVRVNLSNPKRQ